MRVAGLPDGAVLRTLRMCKTSGCNLSWATYDVPEAG